jgi:hypothetical protein
MSGLTRMAGLAFDFTNFINFCACNAPQVAVHKNQNIKNLSTQHATT